MTYTSKPSPKDYAKLRTQPEHIRQEYEARANKALQEQVEKERKHLQQQVDEYKEYATKEIEKAWQEAEHWKQQVEIIYGLLEEAEIEIKKEREKVRVEIERLEREVRKLKEEKARRNKAKRLIE